MSYSWRVIHSVQIVKSKLDSYSKMPMSIYNIKKCVILFFFFSYRTAVRELLPNLEIIDGVSNVP